jgi:hypothetical protein
VGTSQGLKKVAASYCQALTLRYCPAALGLFRRNRCGDLQDQPISALMRRMSYFYGTAVFVGTVAITFVSLVALGKVLG